MNTATQNEAAQNKAVKKLMNVFTKYKYFLAGNNSKHIKAGT